MRATIVSVNLHRHDAIGNYIVSQARWLRDAGCDVRILVEQVADAPLDLVASCRVVQDAAALVAGSGEEAGRLAASAVALFHYPSYYPLVDAIRRPVAGVRVFEFHGVTPPELWAGPGREDLVLGVRNLDRGREAELCIAHSEFSRDQLVRDARVDAARVATMGYPVPLERFEAAARAARGSDPASGAAGGAGVRLLYVGRMARQKRVDLLVEALARVRSAGLDATLSLAGNAQSEPYRRHYDEALRRARALGVEAAVRYHGMASDDELQRLFATSTAYVTASEHEGFCVPVIEAMAAGLPVASTAGGALPETVGGGGLVVPVGDVAALADAVVRLHRDAALRAGVIEAGRARAASFAPDRQRDAFLEILRRAGVRLPEATSSTAAPSGVRGEAERRLAALSEAVRATPQYRDLSHRRGLWRLATRLREALTRHVVRTHVDVIARRHAEALEALVDEVRGLHEALRAERAAREVERAALAARIAALEAERGSGEAGR